MNEGTGRAVDRTRMRTWPGVLVLVTLAACSGGRRVPVAPVAAAPEAPATTDVATPQAPETPAPATPQSPAAAAQAPIPDSVTSKDSAAADTLELEAAFLDSLRAARADTATRRVLPTAVPAEAVRQEAADLLGLPTWDIDVQTYASHERVQYWMDYFTGRSRWHFERYIERAGRYDSMIRTRLAAAGLPQDLLYLAMIESGFAQTIRSRAGAVGVWQFIPATGRRYGLTVDAWMDDRRDPYLSTDAAIRFLSELNNKFGSWYLAAAAYNSGPGKITRGLARGDYSGMSRNDAFFALAEGSFLRRETRDYVPKLIAAALLAKQPDRYGFTNLALWVPLTYDSVMVPFAVGMDVLARMAGTTRSEIEDLNPRFLRGVTPPDRRVWVKIPVGTAETVAARVAALPPSERVTVLYHTVSRGETLSALGRRYGVSVEDIKSANRMRNSRLARGQRLVIPTSLGRARGSAVAQAPSRRATTTAPRATTGSTTTRSTTARAAATRPATRSATTTRRVHVVRAGESPYSIATAFGVPLADLLAANGLTRRSVIRPGQSIRIPN